MSFETEARALADERQMLLARLEQNRGDIVRLARRAMTTWPREPNANVSALARIIGVTRPVIYDWVSRAA